jgi:hypothetical protein
MTDVNDRIRRLFDTATPLTLDEVVARAAPAPFRRPRVYVRLVVAACVLVVAGVVAVIATHRTSGGVVVSSGPSPTASSAPPPIIVRTVLDQTTVTAGSSIHGEVIVTNTTGKPIPFVENCPGNYDDLAKVGLSNAQIGFQDFQLGVGCVHDSVPLAPGITRYPITVSTYYASCDGGRVGSEGLPVCLPGGGIPLLPAGDYVTQTYFNGPAPGIFPVAPVAVKVLPAHG